MTNRGSRRWLDWRFFDGAVSISASTWLAIALSECHTCAGWPLLGLLSRLAAANETGIIVVATALLFPTAAALFGGVFMFFAAKDAAERWSRAREEKAMAKSREKGRAEGREEGLEEGWVAGRAEIVALLKEHDVPELPPEVLSKLNGAGDSG